MKNFLLSLCRFAQTMTVLMPRPAPLTMALVILLAFQTALPAASFGFNCTYSTATVGVTPPPRPGEQTQVNTAPSGQCGASASLSATDYVTAFGNISPFSQSASATESGTAALGILGMSSSAQATSTPAAYFYDVGGSEVAVNNTEDATANAAGEAQWFDTFAIHGPTGVPISLIFTITLDSTESAEGRASVSNVEQDLTINGGPDGEVTGGLQGSGMQTVSVTVSPGTVLDVMGDLIVVTQADAGGLFSPYVSESSATVDASHTAAFYVQVTTPGGSYTDASGYAYPTSPSASSVPEGETGAMVALGVLLLLIRKNVRFWPALKVEKFG